MIDLIIIVSATLFLNSTLGSIFAYRLNNMGFVDIFWASGLAVTAFVLYIKMGTSSVQLIFIGLIVLWALRLISFLLITRYFKGEKDKRYTRIEEKWDRHSFFKVIRHFYFQAFFQSFLCGVFIPIFLTEGLMFGVIQWISVVFFGAALCGQHVADKQLYEFKLSKQSGVLRTGLWQYCRHPNYFFEWLIWVSLALYSFQSMYYLWAWIAPGAIFIVMRFMTGPYTEKLSLEKRKGAFKDYQDSVPMFFPGITLIIKSFFK